MSKIYQYLLSSIWIFSAPLYATGGVIQGGGGIVSCSVFYNGEARRVHFSTDYLITVKSEADIAEPWRYKDVPEGSTVESWLYDFRNMLKSKIPDNAFEWFRELANAQMGDQDDPSLFAWHPLKDSDVPSLSTIQPDILKSLSAQCLDMKLQLLMLREESSSHEVMYRYNEQETDDGLGLTQLQLSFFIVHEWLWNFTRDPVAVRRANQYIHSQEFYDATSAEAISKLTELGINIRRFDL